MRVNKLFAFISLFYILAISEKGLSQDIQFSQFYGSPLYLNPAFAGSSHHYRGILHQRIQWPGLDAKYITSLASIDGYSNDYKSGYALMFIKDFQGTRSLNSTEVSGQYAYELHLTEKYTLRFGLQGTFSNRSLNFNNLSFPNQFDGSNYTLGSFEDSLKGSKSYFDVSSGTVFYTERLFAGISWHHINTPNQSFVGGNVSSLPAKFGVIAGYKIPLVHKKHMAYLEAEKDISITPTVYYKSQGKSDQLDFGVYANYDQLIAAIWYRGIPVKHYETGLHNNESMVGLVGWSFGNIQVAYSYDFIVSKLRPARSGGSHEITLTFIQQKHHKNAKPMRRLPCPTFYKKHTNHAHHLQHHQELEEHHHQQFQH